MEVSTLENLMAFIDKHDSVLILAPDGEDREGMLLNHFELPVLMIYDEYVE